MEPQTILKLMLRRFLVFLPILIAALIVGLILGKYARKSDLPEALKTEEVTVALTPSTQEVKTEQFALKLSDLKITKTIDKSTKEFAETPSLKGTLRIINRSNGIVGIQGVTIQYLDHSGDPISFKTGEKNVTVSTYWQDLKPGEASENSLNVTTPRAAFGDKPLSLIRIKVIYIPSPLKRETFDVPVSVEKK